MKNLITNKSLLLEAISEYEKKIISETDLLTIVCKETEKKDFAYLLESLFTKSELTSFSNRLLIIKKLKEGLSQHAIAGQIKVGVETVSRGASEIKKGKFKFI